MVKAPLPPLSYLALLTSTMVVGHLIEKERHLGGFSPPDRILL
jgi:hypothetical protein